MLTGKHPFSSSYQEDRIDQILNKEPDYSWVPVKATSLIKKLLEKDPKKRISAFEAMQSQFLLRHCETPHKTHKHSEKAPYYSQKAIEWDNECDKSHKKSHDTDDT